MFPLLVLLEEPELGEEHGRDAVEGGAAFLDDGAKRERWVEGFAEATSVQVESSRDTHAG